MSPQDSSRTAHTNSALSLNPFKLLPGAPDPEQLQIKGTQMGIRNFCVGKPEELLRIQPAAKPAQQAWP